MRFLLLALLIAFNVSADDTAMWVCGYHAKFIGPDKVINEKGGSDLYEQVRDISISGDDIHYLKADGIDESTLLFSYPNIHGKQTEVTISGYNKSLFITVVNNVKSLDPEEVIMPTNQFQIGDKANDSSFRALFTTEDMLRIEISCTKILVRADKEVSNENRSDIFKPTHPIMNEAGSDNYSSVIKN